MILFYTLIPLYIFNLNKRYIGLKIAYDSKDKERVRYEVFLSVLSIGVIIYLIYITALIARII